MKQAISFFAIIISGITPSLAQTMLRVSLTDKTPITIAVDGRYFNKSGESVTVNDLPQGRHNLKVFVFTSAAQTSKAMVWEGRIKTYRGQLTSYSINPYNHEAVSSDQDMPAPGAPTPPTDAQGYNNHNLNNYDTRETHNSDYQQNNQPNTTTPPPVENNETVDPLPPGTPVASPVSIDEPEEKPVATKGSKMDKLKATVAAKGTDTEKMELLKKSLKNDKLTTAKVQTIMDWFSFEKSKADFAKWAYPKITDKKNFKNVKQQLTMKEYREEIDQLIKKHK